MPHAVSMPSPGVQALILCGPGSSFPTFTSNPDENPKALLPIANRPMVWYPIDFCYRAGITNITLICPPSAEEAITTGLNTDIFLTALPLPRPDILAPKDLDFNMGTAEILRLPEVKELVTSDFVVLPCDLVCEVGGETLLQAWQVRCASLIEAVGANKFSNDELARCSGGLGVWYDAKANTPIKKEETDFIATAPLPSPAATPPKDSLFSGVSKLVYSTPTDSLKDSMEERGGLSLRHGLLRANPQVRMLTTHRDAHIYIFPQWVMEFVKRNERMESISEDVVGWWAKAGWQAGLAEKLHIKEVCSPSQNDEGSLSSPTSESSPGLPSSGQQSNGLIEPTTNMALDLIGEKAAETEVPSILAYVHSGAKQATGSLIRRVDTAQLLLAISLQLAKLPSLEETGPDSPSPYAHSRKVAYPEGVKSRTTITKQDCLIGENVTVEEKVAIKESVVGIGCQIDEGAKISQCLLMEGVKVGKNCKLTKCILGKRCVIGDGSVLTDCEVQENLLVEPRSESPLELPEDKDNKLMSSEGLEATEAEMEEVLQEQEDAEATTGEAMAE
ncbi:Translation initiation factor subunit gamma-like protein [Hapsidospora chrysogenum ATCC 11550]|uniref:Translation initiation factor eIF2B subunit gamma n=1 Tax=Hapsidospora chrysogenum (strain ATCC 11550 / CBS 779.69 / DSM 880 / IAM 14645 / JCM 23072 / IMI 49137) TaxID=857340 RepID=A0A086TGA2_HAPC1|nr:Translation initiation factor subunit gamma-like protein [Hapsidospora chrysogenum ATCC 11550]